MKSYKHIIFIKNYIFAKFDYNILKNNKNQPIVNMAAIRYIALILLFLTYLQCAAMSSMYTKFHQCSSKTEADMARSSAGADYEYIVYLAL